MKSGGSLGRAVLALRRVTSLLRRKLKKARVDEMAEPTRGSIDRASRVDELALGLQYKAAGRQRRG